jgi:uncharacterized protein (DUF362 family)
MIRRSVGKKQGEIGRRQFLKAAGMATIAAATGTLGCTSQSAPITPSATPSITPRPTREPLPRSNRLVVAADEDPAKAVDKALDAYGGLSDIVRSGDRVLVKANFSFSEKVETGAANHPDVLSQILRRVKGAGASEVIVVDHTIDSPKLCLDYSGLKAAAERTGCSAVSVNDQGEYVEKTFKCGDLGSVQVMKRLFDADVFINAPVIKSHGMTRMTASLKNLMGLIYDRQAFHSFASLDACIADLAKALQPDLVVADAYRVLATAGPRGGGVNDVITTPHEIIVGDDMVAVDAYAATLLGAKPQDISHVLTAYTVGVGEIDTGKLNFQRV